MARGPDPAPAEPGRPATAGGSPLSTPLRSRPSSAHVAGVRRPRGGRAERVPSGCLTVVNEDFPVVERGGTKNYGWSVLGAALNAELQAATPRYRPGRGISTRSPEPGQPGRGLSPGTP